MKPILGQLFTQIILKIFSQIVKVNGTTPPSLMIPNIFSLGIAQETGCAWSVFRRLNLSQGQLKIKRCIWIQRSEWTRHHRCTMVPVWIDTVISFSGNKTVQDQQNQLWFSFALRITQVKFLGIETYEITNSCNDSRYFYLVCLKIKLEEFAVHKRQ